MAAPSGDESEHAELRNGQNGPMGVITLALAVVSSVVVSSTSGREIVRIAERASFSEHRGDRVIGLSSAPTSIYRTTLIYVAAA